MKLYQGILLALAATIWSCGSKNKFPPADAEMAVTDSIANDTVRIANDELEYEIIIIDPGFNTWLVSRARPRHYYSQQYLETRNKLWVMEWNARVVQPQRFGDLYQMRIEYDPQTDYGYEVNYLLYNYLVYFQLTNGQRLGGIVPQY